MNWIKGMTLTPALTSAEYKSKATRAQSAKSKQAEMSHVKRTLATAELTTEMGGNKEFIDCCNLTILESGICFLPIDNNVDEYINIYEAYYHVPTQDNINKILTLKYDPAKAVPSVFQKEYGAKHFRYLPKQILIEKCGSINRILSLASDNVLLMKMMILYILNSQARLSILCYIADRFNKPSAITALTYKYPIEVLDELSK